MVNGLRRDSQTLERDPASLHKNFGNSLHHAEHVDAIAERSAPHLFVRKTAEKFGEKNTVEMTWQDTTHLQNGWKQVNGCGAANRIDDIVPGIRGQEEKYKISKVYISKFIIKLNSDKLSALQLGIKETERTEHGKNRRYWDDNYLENQWALLSAPAGSPLWITVRLLSPLQSHRLLQLRQLKSPVWVGNVTECLVRFPVCVLEDRMLSFLTTSGKHHFS